MKLVTNFFLFCFICLISISIKSQNVTANIESDSILIGKELFYTIDIDMEKAENIIFPDSTSFIPFELISETPVDTIIHEDEFGFSKKYGIISFDEGDFIIPKIKIKIGYNESFVDGLSLTVVTPMISSM